MDILKSSAPLLALVAPLPFALAVFYLVVRTSERADKSGGAPAPGERPWQFRLADAGFLVLYVALGITVVQWLARENSLPAASTAVTFVLAALLAVWLWLVGIRVLWRRRVDRARRRLAVMLVLPLGLAGAVCCPSLVVMVFLTIGGLVFDPDESVLPALETVSMLLVCVFGLVVTARVIAWAVARDEPPGDGQPTEGAPHE